MNLTFEHFESTGLTIYQPAKGHRYGEESLLLADFCCASPHERIVEFGSGVGVVALQIARLRGRSRFGAAKARLRCRSRFGAAKARLRGRPRLRRRLRRGESRSRRAVARAQRVGAAKARLRGRSRFGAAKARRLGISGTVAVEIQEELHRIALKNVLLNKMEQNVVCVNDDWRKFASDNPSSFDLVISNPPFYAAGSGRQCADLQRAAARHEIAGTISDLIVSVKKVLRPRGRLEMVFTKSRRDELLRVAGEHGFKMARHEDSFDDVFLVEFCLNCDH